MDPVAVAASNSGNSHFASAVAQASASTSRGLVRWDATYSLQSPLLASNRAKNDYFGANVATSGDGKEIFVEAPGKGAVYIFTRGDAGFTQTAELMPNPPSGGATMAVSADGSTVAMDCGVEEVCVFQRAAGWLNQGSNEVATISATYPNGDPFLFGTSLALSSDGLTLLVGAPGYEWSGDNVPGEVNGSITSNGGAGVIYQADAPGDSYTQEAILAVDDGCGTDNDEAGFSVALSSDGSEAVLGDPGKPYDCAKEATDSAGATQEFDEPAKGWSAANQYGNGIYETGAYDNSDFADIEDVGKSVAISGDGNTILVGSEYTQSQEKAAALVLDRAAAGLTFQYAATLSDPTTSCAAGTGVFGGSIALDGDGATALVGAGGHGGYLFAKGLGWSTGDGNQVGDLCPTSIDSDYPEDNVGTAVAIAGDGKTAVIGAPTARIGCNMATCATGAAYLALETTPTSTSISAPSDTAIYGQSTTFTATVSSSSAGDPGGSVNFYLDGSTTPMNASPVAVSTSSAKTTAQFSTSSIAAGASAHTVSAAYSGDFSFAGSDSSGDPLDLTVSPAKVTVTAGSPQMNYGAVVPTISHQYSGFVNGDTAGVISGTPECSANATSASPTGEYPTSCDIASLSALNYTFSAKVGTLSIKNAVLTVTAGSPTMTYGGKVPVVGFAYSGFVNGDDGSVIKGTPDCATTATGSSGVGSYSTRCDLASLTAANYNFKEKAGIMRVKKATVKVSASSPSMTYGGAVPAIISKYSGFKNGDGSSVISGKPVCSAGATSRSPIGNYVTICNISGLSASNYGFSSTDGSLTIGRATLTVKAQNVSMTYGSQPVAITFRFAGFVNGDDASAVTGTPVCTTTATHASPTGVYPTSCDVSGLSAKNYLFLAAPGLITISPATIVVTAASPTISYGASIPAIGYVYSGWVNGGSAKVVKRKPKCATRATSKSPPGQYPDTCTIVGLLASNYRFKAAPGSLTITKSSLTASYTGPRSLKPGQGVSVSARLVNSSGSRDAPGVRVTFTLAPPSKSAPSCSSTTGSSGVAACKFKSVKAASGAKTLQISWTKTANFTGGTHRTTVAVAKKGR